MTAQTEPDQVEKREEPQRGGGLFSRFRRRRAKRGVETEAQRSGRLLSGMGDLPEPMQGRHLMAEMFADLNAPPESPPDAASHLRFPPAVPTAPSSATTDTASAGAAEIPDWDEEDALIRFLEPYDFDEKKQEQRVKQLRQQLATLNPMDRIALLGNQSSEAAQRELHNAIEEIELADIAVVAFVGQSGTGKSTKAIETAKRYNIHYIIDDGLLIHGSQIIAGTSAKRANTGIESVRRATFHDANRAAAMRRALVTHRPTTLMILGTSEQMLERICANLRLNKPGMMIRIEDVTTEEERQAARRVRRSTGQHTIPVPSIEIKHEFSGTFFEPLGLLRRWRERSSDAPLPESGERTVVRPTFSSLGSYSMSDNAFRSMIDCIVREVPGVQGLANLETEKSVYGVMINAGLTLYYGYETQTVLAQTQQRIAERVVEYTALNVISVNVTARRLAEQTKKLE